MTGVTLVVDAANVVGSRPDGWWRDRAGATSRLLGRLAPLTGATVSGPGGATITVEAVVVVVEGRARQVPAGTGLSLVRAEADGDASVVEAAGEVLRAGGTPLVVTADRGLRARLPERAQVTGPGWLLGLDALRGAP